MILILYFRKLFVTIDVIKKPVLKTFAFLLVLIAGVAAVPVANAQHEEQELGSRLYYYSGHAGADKVELNLRIEGTLVYGSYIVERTSDLFIFRGRLTSDRAAFEALVFDENDKHVASLQANLVSDDSDFATEIKGILKMYRSKRSVSLSLQKMAELAVVLPDHSVIEAGE